MSCSAREGLTWYRASDQVTVIIMCIYHVENKGLVSACIVHILYWFLLFYCNHQLSLSYHVKITWSQKFCSLFMETPYMRVNKIALKPWKLQLIGWLGGSIPLMQGSHLEKKKKKKQQSYGQYMHKVVIYMLNSNEFPKVYMVFWWKNNKTVCFLNISLCGALLLNCLWWWLFMFFMLYKTCFYMRAL